ncbi:2-C-methyl-D-erythritol 4-phosphate cytidylyltransferase [Sulfitobacter sp. F26204]|uniref:2-C-methyl-D-erythritol 4-phosphate cytidylyltransferase n=1 Tax=Sulfitobacter sp. F26204 TaxID=2996014 RepID=UPI00225DEB1F|nr:2-C-methyl-D-erythritol 4-phosphate cytidylyltransferase [Sulfitobacter sp. F26204]MCX7561625.1 2-C-methyl-D-erythritol 4-phosphate cytidylyltransferase [Sulfitobacter sp. F26204]
MSESSTNPKTRAAVLIVAAGRGRRFGSEVPKQYVPIDGLCAFRRCLETFLGMPEIAAIQTVIHPDDKDRYATVLAGLDDDRLCPPTFGGNTRVQSVMNGLDALTDQAPDVVLVHDAARAFVTREIVIDVLAALDQGDAAFAALPVVDALWRGEGDQALTPVARSGLWRAQTPQGFRFEVLRRAHLDYDGEAADDVEIARAMGIAVKIVTGDPANFKITTPQDLARAERFVASGR